MQSFWGRHWKVLILGGLIFLGLVGWLLWKLLAQGIGINQIGIGGPRSAAIVIDTAQVTKPLRPIWDGVSQGFEKLPDQDFRLGAVAPLLKGVGASYVRIDHVFDGFNVISRGGSGLQYDWSKLDAIVGDILAAGATPYISISYMPTEISKSNILDEPKDWGEWGQVVAALVGHYSRDYRGGLNNVIYEVWNEPDLFGGWKMNRGKSYTQLFSVASNAAVSVRGAKPFKIGGPATTGFYTAWVYGFYDKLDSSVRIDFFSWHRYSANVADFVKDATTAKALMETRISRSQDLYISEWGVNPERGSQYDSRWAGAHFLAVNAALSETNVDLALTFEVMDGAPADQQFHGGWGMLTNPKYGAVAKKPRFKAWEMITKMRGSQLAKMGEGTYIYALGTMDATGIIRVMAVNYDVNGKHEEKFPLTLIGLTDGSYSVGEQYLSGKIVNTTTEVVGGSMRREISLSASDAVLLTVTKK